MPANEWEFQIENYNINRGGGYLSCSKCFLMKTLNEKSNVNGLILARVCACVRNNIHNGVRLRWDVRPGIYYILYVRDSSPQHSGPPRNLTASIGPQGRDPDTLIAGARRRSIYYDTYILTRCTQKIIQKKITILMIIIIIIKTVRN